MKIGFVGGSFNPVHNGHLRVAIEVKEQMNLDWVEFIPAPRPPHKSHKDIVSFKKRVMLLKKAVDGINFLKINTLEENRDGPSYTVDTLKELRRIYLNYDLFFVIGGDEVLSLDKWYKWKELFFFSHFIVVGRRDKDLLNLKKFIYQKLTYAKQQSNFFWKIGKYKLYYINIPRLEISSSMIRKKAMNGNSLRGLVPESIEKDIYKIYCKKSS